MSFCTNPTSNVSQKILYHNHNQTKQQNCVQILWDILYIKPQRRHDIETFSMLLALCEGNPLVNGGFPSQRSRSNTFFMYETVELLVN